MDAVAHRLTRKGRELQVHVIQISDDVDGGHALIFGEATDGCLVRIHSRCLYGDVLASDDCDCGPELEQALDAIQEAGAGILVYLEQEGRGAGLTNKARGLQTSERLGLDTYAAYERLGLDADTRCFKLAAEALASLGLRSARLLTSNPAKVGALREAGISVAVVDVSTEPRSERARAYQAAKRRRAQAAGTDRPSILQPYYNHAALMDSRPTPTPPPPRRRSLWDRLIAVLRDDGRQ
ncbi:GTP cyclohydrolase II RibA [Nocardia sp. NBC_00565]|uniref:GTP cyclohydrolase II RibA n=1 Tax=Nocardia sp. NBC_00565 TaxID=2975993 RepID=UPI002E8116FA|nr:GTP cyclohydrolase II RibA [Nocardia sp. NBC_00565]WUC03697.1 GTP cyclohydrolase II RibA [Nocardia sp. NBC_00565]